MTTTTLGKFGVKGATDANLDSTGRVHGIAATLNAIDHDGDVVAPGALRGTARVPLSAWGHSAVFSGTPPIGWGRVYEDGTRWLFDAVFALDTAAGRDGWVTLRTLHDAGVPVPWSWGFRPLRVADPTPSQRAAGARRVLQEVHVIELSPVIEAASIGTGILGVHERAEQAAIHAETTRLAATQRRVSHLLRSVQPLMPDAETAVARAGQRALQHTGRLLRSASSPGQDRDTVVGRAGQRAVLQAGRVLRLHRCV